MRNDRLRLQDILDAIAIIEQDTPADRGTFDANRAIKSHVLLHVQIIGEAVSRLSQVLRDQNPQVPWKPIARMRNIIAHVYFGIDWDQVWQVARNEIPALKLQVEAIIATLPPEPGDPDR